MHQDITQEYNFELIRRRVLSLGKSHKVIAEKTKLPKCEKAPKGAKALTQQVVSKFLSGQSVLPSTAKRIIEDGLGLSIDQTLRQRRRTA